MAHDMRSSGLESKAVLATNPSIDNLIAIKGSEVERLDDLDP